MRRSVPGPRHAVAALGAFLFETDRQDAADAADAREAEPRTPAEEHAARKAPPVMLATAIGDSGGAAAVAAAIGVALSDHAGGRSVLLADLDPPSRGRGPTVLASEAARQLEDRVRSLGGRFRAAVARGHLCYLPLAHDQDPFGPVAELLGRPLPAAAVIVHVPQAQWPRAVADPRLRARAGLMRADLPTDRSLAALAVRELHDRGLRAKVVSRPLGRVASRRALAGVEPGGAASGRAARLARGLLAGRSGQGLVLVVGAGAALIFTAHLV